MHRRIMDETVIAGMKVSPIELYVKLLETRFTNLLEFSWTNDEKQFVQSPFTYVPPYESGNFRINQAPPCNGCYCWRQKCYKGTAGTNIMRQSLTPISSTHKITKHECPQRYNQFITKQKNDTPSWSKMTVRMRVSPRSPGPPAARLIIAEL